jgi:putative Mg2+ transporter-C (MgtC) family protein
MNEVHLFESWDRLTALLPVFMVRCGVAALCGGLIGLERELKNKPAGFRTNILICLGSAMYMAVGLLLVNVGGQESDPARIAAQVVTGIGFLGAGCIIQQRERVKGLTTAATIWVVAAIGIVAGAGFPVLAFIASTMVLVTLVVLGGIEKRFLDPEHSDDYDGERAKGQGRKENDL